MSLSALPLLHEVKLPGLGAGGSKQEGLRHEPKLSLRHEVKLSKGLCQFLIAAEKFHPSSINCLFILLLHSAILHQATPLSPVPQHFRPWNPGIFPFFTPVNPTVTYRQSSKSSICSVLEMFSPTNVPKIGELHQLLPPGVLLPICQNVLTLCHACHTVQWCTSNDDHKIYCTQPHDQIWRD